MTAIERPAAGYRDRTTGKLTNVGTGASYTSVSSFSATSARGSVLWFTAGNTDPLYDGYRANARSVRCVQHLRKLLSL